MPERVYDTRRQQFADFEVMLADLARADVIFVGEQHDDPNTHRLEAAILEGLQRRGAAVTLSLEMFERDVQGDLDAYLAGGMADDAVPQGIAAVAALCHRLPAAGRDREGEPLAGGCRQRAAAARVGGGEERAGRARVALAGRAPHDRARSRVPARIATSSASPRAWAATRRAGEKISAAEQAATTDRYYCSQCVKDETMAESIAAAFNAGPRPIVHVNGAFHSDFGLGTAERVKRRLAGRRVVIVSILPVKDIDAAAPSAEDLKRADYLVYTVQ